MTDTEALPALGIEQFDGPTELPPEPIAHDDGETLPGDTPPKKRRRRRKTVEAAPAVDPELARQEKERALGDLRTALDLTFRVGFDMLADWRKDPRWALNPDECGAMSEAWSVALLPYMGTVGKHMPMLSALIVTAGVVIPRLTSDDAKQKLSEATPATGEVVQIERPTKRGRNGA